LPRGWQGNVYKPDFLFDNCYLVVIKFANFKAERKVHYEQQVANAINSCIDEIDCYLGVLPKVVYPEINYGK
jgi:hypothetical protein